MKLFVCFFQISEIQECKHIHDLFLLRDLNLLGNPVQVTQPFTDHSVLLLKTFIQCVEIYHLPSVYGFLNLTATPVFTVFSLTMTCECN